MNVKTWCFNFIQLFKVSVNLMFGICTIENILQHFYEHIQFVRVVGETEFADFVTDVY